MNEGDNMSKKSNTLLLANKTINSDRIDKYGTPENSFRIIADYWNTYLFHKAGFSIDLNQIDIAHMMSLFKQARMIGQKPNIDNYVDACGYLAIAGDKFLD